MAAGETLLPVASRMLADADRSVQMQELAGLVTWPYGGAPQACVSVVAETVGPYHRD